ncbi:DUF6356 family protein [Thalassococcus sp. BH17M4-6]|uniref:DUF6356 family protein n=1 Tax=Thalassococcus sp. BH17M4-6 TaxID=3413148 RepID=UPI003BD23527
MTTTLTAPLSRLFRDHPAKVGESYLQHMFFALGFAFWLAVAAGAALVHALIPALCETTASRILCRLHGRITRRHAR